VNRNLTFAAIPIVLVLLGGTIQVARPLPAVEVRPTASQMTLPGQLAVTFPSQGQAAIGEDSLGLVTETPNEQPAAIASLTKMMTAYLYLKAKPLAVGQDGPVTTITAADEQIYQQDKAAGDSVAKVSAGEKLTERQILEALMLPSADNIATLIANQVAGSEAAFIKKMNETAKELGMTQTTYSDTSGVNPSTVSTAHDQILMARAAMQDRTFREVVRMPQADLPVARRVFNVNFMVGKQGISGVKTGSTLAAGSCFVGSYPFTVGGVPHTLYCAVLGQQSLRVALTEDVAILHAAAPQFVSVPLPASETGVAQLTAPWNESTPLKTTAPVQVFGYPGMSVKLAAKLTHAGLPIQAGAEVAALAVTAGPSTQSVALVADRPIQPPGFLWRLHR
jgi:D-alanyl-D-alanine carboxypeptidase (penicillin-binding protein 5/6)